MFDSPNPTTTTNNNNNIKEADQGKNKSKKRNTKSGKNASPKICTFFYIVYFLGEAAVSNPIDNRQQQPIKYKNNRQLNQIINENSEMVTKEAQYISTPNSLLNFSNNNGVYFKTEVYYEAIDGIKKNRKRNPPSNSGDNNQQQTTTVNTPIDYFRNLSNIEIVNMIYMIDFKAFLTIQSMYAMFLSKGNCLQTMFSLLNSSRIDQTDLNNSHFSESILSNFKNYDSEFLDSIRLLPDINILLKKHGSRLSKNDSNNMFKSSGNLLNRIKFDHQSLNQTIKLKKVCIQFLFFLKNSLK